MLLRCCLIHVSIIILRHFLYLLYLCSCLGLDLFMSYVYVLSSHLFFCLFFRIRPIIFGWWKTNSNNKSLATGCYLSFAWYFANFSLALIIKVLTGKKACTMKVLPVQHWLFSNFLFPRFSISILIKFLGYVWQSASCFVY